MSECVWVKDQLCEHEFIPRENFDPSSDPKTMTSVFLQSSIQWRRIGLMPHPEMGILVWKPLRLGSVFSVLCHDKGWELL